MANVRVCLYIFVLFVSYKLVDAEVLNNYLRQPVTTADATRSKRREKPTTSAWCSFFNCDTDDDGSDDDDDDDDYYDLFDILGLCDGCSKSPSSSKPQRPEPVEIMLPPSSGLNLSVSSSANGAVVMNLKPWAAAPATAAKPQATTAAPSATTAAGSTAATTAKVTTKKP